MESVQKSKEIHLEAPYPHLRQVGGINIQQSTAYMSPQKIMKNTVGSKIFRKQENYNWIALIAL